VDRLTAKLVNRLTATLVNCLTAKLMNRLTAKLVDRLTTKLVVVNLVKLHLTKFFLGSIGSDHNFLFPKSTFLNVSKPSSGCTEAVRSVASGRKFYQLPPDKENTDRGQAF